MARFPLRPNPSVRPGRPDERFDVLGARRLAIGLPRQQPSRPARRTTGSPRLSGSHAARGRRHPPRYCFPDGIGRTPQAKTPEAIVPPGHARDRNARKALARPLRAGRALRHGCSSRVDRVAVTARRSPNCALATIGGRRQTTSGSFGPSSQRRHWHRSVSRRPSALPITGRSASARPYVSGMYPQPFRRRRRRPRGRPPSCRTDR